MNKKYYITEDLHLTAYLTGSGQAELTEIIDNSTWKKHFKLYPIPNEKTISEFYTGTAKISALRLCESLRSLKAAIRNKEISSGV